MCTKWYLSSGPLRLHFSLSWQGDSCKSLFAVLFLLYYLIILLFWMHFLFHILVFLGTGTFNNFLSFHLIPINPSTLVEVLHVCKLSIRLFSILASSCTRDCRGVLDPVPAVIGQIGPRLTPWTRHQFTAVEPENSGRTMLTPQRKVPGLESNPQPSVKETMLTTATPCPVSSPHSSAHINIHKAENHNPPL